MNVPGPWSAILLALASYRIWKLLAEDSILDTPRHRLVRLPDDWQEGRALPKDYRYKLAEFINCPWCFGFWISIAVWILWQIDEHWTTVFAVPFAISAALGFSRARLDPPDD